MAVSAISIIKHFDVVEHIRPGKIASFVDTFSNAFFFQATKERFGNRVIPTVSASAHAGYQIECLIDKTDMFSSEEGAIAFRHRGDQMSVDLYLAIIGYIDAADGY